MKNKIKIKFHLNENIDKILLQVDNLNVVTNLEKYCFYAMLIICKCMPLCKKLNYDAKSEPPYLATIPLE